MQKSWTVCCFLKKENKDSLRWKFMNYYLIWESVLFVPEKKITKDSIRWKFMRQDYTHKGADVITD
jgi:hypothetical protein